MPANQSNMDVKERIEGTLKICATVLPFAGSLMVNKRKIPFSWSIEIEGASAIIKQYAFACSSVLVDSCDGHGQGIIQMSSFDEVQILGSGSWTAK